MAFGNRVGIGGGEVGAVWFAVGREVLRAGKRGFDECGDSCAGKPAMLGNLPVMDRLNDIQGDPYPGRYFARACRMSRSSRMMSSAIAICSAKTGL